MKSTRSIAAVAILALMVVVPLAGCSASVAPKPPQQSVVPFVGQETTATAAGKAEKHAIITITDTVSPATVTVKVGGRVVWQNDSKQSHSITIKGGPKSPAIKAGASASHVFDKAGTYTFWDASFPTIQGTIIVK